ncbi:MAG TPA: RcnB family protein [Sphingomicrobium sp.]|jgi:Ni/Co efflux regulator RcnB|nr:RcnB family protein [Sphingomicrobium sp.]
MRKILISLLLAGVAATPAIARSNGSSDPQQTSDNHQQAHDSKAQAHDERQQARDERQSAHDERVQMREQSRGGPGGNPNPGQAQGYAHPERVNDQQQSYGGGQERYYGRSERGNFAGRYAGEGNYVAPGPRVVTPGSRFGGRYDERGFDRPDRAHGMRPVSNVPRPGTQPPLRVEGDRAGDFHWNRGWRNDNHYDWRRYRDHHRSLFHPGLYLDPFGWGYEPFSVGWRLWPAYYDNQYWIDPGMYELPYPPPGAVWVRYWNDALLVDTYSGTVIDVIPGFFW